ncbi:uncharacterized protein LOC130782056 [Actinidia eriantha]|uniref:uncharacterized protein LOC130782056 n=1 Tax=Actinidia eriantha TaxID=165200 RepID=UPI0025911F4E|nr:uncharacterized protein LOC130782056 [Actinidia eriantha]
MASRVPIMVLSPMAIEGSSTGGRSGLLSDLVVSIEGSPCGVVSFNLETPASGNLPEFCREQMAIVLRFVDKDGVVQERFFDIVHITNAASATLKKGICRVLALHNLSVQNIRGQEYDDASNMRGRWNGLKHNTFKGIRVIELAEKLAIDNDDDHDEDFETVLKDIINDPETTMKQHHESNGVYDVITSFEFVFILHLMREVMEYTDDLCQALQPCRGRVRKDKISIEHHFRVEVFTDTIDSQLLELNSRFKEDTIELLVFSTSLDPRDGYKSFKIEDICKLVEKYYPMNFTERRVQFKMPKFSR